MAFVQSLPPSNGLVIVHGRMIAEWGDPAKPIKVSSIRKSILSGLFGIYTHDQCFNLDSTLANLSIDDDPPLTANERSATVRMLLKSRSGIYHGYVAGTPSMKLDYPSRGSHAPGTFWFYNNWDFNALGSIFEREFNISIAQAFESKLASPLGLQDFRLEDMYYQRALDAAPEDVRSIHPAYHFRLSARDLGRLGYLYLRQGRWEGHQVIPKGWIAESLRSYSVTEPGEGYAYLWWIDGFGLGTPTFSARGALAKYLIMIPSADAVVVYLNDTEFPDAAASMSAAELKALPTITRAQMGQFLRLLVSAKE